MIEFPRSIRHYERYVSSPVDLPEVLKKDPQAWSFITGGTDEARRQMAMSQLKVLAEQELPFIIERGVDLMERLHRQAQKELNVPFHLIGKRVLFVDHLRADPGPGWRLFRRLLKARKKYHDPQNGKIAVTIITSAHTPESIAELIYGPERRNFENREHTQQELLTLLTQGHTITL